VAERRRAVAFLGAEQVARMLALPPGVHVVAVGDDFLRNGVRVLVEGDALDLVPEDHEAPRLDARVRDAAALTDTEILGALVSGFCVVDGPNVGVDCPRCSWSRGWERGRPTLGAVVDALRQHIAGAHT
jgi:hypothetical protein